MDQLFKFYVSFSSSFFVQKQAPCFINPMFSLAVVRWRVRREKDLLAEILVLFYGVITSDNLFIKLENMNK